MFYSNRMASFTSTSLALSAERMRIQNEQTAQERRSVAISWEVESHQCRRAYRRVSAKQHQWYSFRSDVKRMTSVIESRRTSSRGRASHKGSISLVEDGRQKHRVQNGCRFTCDTCGKGFRSHRDFGTHMNVHAKIKPYKCEQCNRKFKNKRSFHKHTCTAKPIGSVYNCTVCAETFRSKKARREHCVSHSSAILYSCDVCSERFKSRLGWKNHKAKCGNSSSPLKLTPPSAQLRGGRCEQKRVNGDTCTPKPRLICEKCARPFYSRTALEKHVHSHERGSNVITIGTEEGDVAGVQTTPARTPATKPSESEDVPDVPTGMAEAAIISFGTLDTTSDTPAILKGPAGDEQGLGKGTSELDSCMFTPPSAQLRGGPCEQKNVKEASVTLAGLLGMMSEAPATLKRSKELVEKAPTASTGMRPDVSSTLKGAPALDEEAPAMLADALGMLSEALAATVKETSGAESSRGPAMPAKTSGTSTDRPETASTALAMLAGTSPMKLEAVPLMFTPPSAHLRGGRSEHKKIEPMLGGTVTSLSDEKAGLLASGASATLLGTGVTSAGTAMRARRDVVTSNGTGATAIPGGTSPTGKTSVKQGGMSGVSSASTPEATSIASAKLRGISGGSSAAKAPEVTSPTPAKLQALSGVSPAARTPRVTPVAPVRPKEDSGNFVAANAPEITSAAPALLAGTEVPASNAGAAKVTSSATSNSVPAAKRGSESQGTAKKSESTKSHLCGECGLAFTYKMSLVSHRREKHNFGPGCRYTCETCGRGFMHYREYESHVNMHSNSKPHACQKCDKKFAHERGLQRHKCRPKKIHACSVCGKVFSDRNRLEAHEPAHDELPRFQCALCSRRYRYLSGLRQHKWECAGFKQKSFDTVTGNLQTNVRTENRTKKYACTDCSKAFSSKQKLDRHMPFHDAVARYSCDSCSKRFKFSSGLTKHKSKCDGCRQKTVHTCAVTPRRLVPFVCSYCAEAFYTKKTFQKHLLTHRGDTRVVSFGSPDHTLLPDDHGIVGSFKKSSPSGTSDARTVAVNPISLRGPCGPRPTGTSGAKRVMKAFRDRRPSSASKAASESTDPKTSRKRHPCPDCGLVFGYSSGLRRHRRGKHGLEGGFQFVCGICGKGTMKLVDFESHMNMHAKAKPYECKRCTTKFASKRSLRQHKCTGKRPHSCTVCGKLFERRGFLLRHVSSHDNLRVYQCSLCSGQFKFRSNLNYHKRLCTEGRNKKLQPYGHGGRCGPVPKGTSGTEMASSVTRTSPSAHTRGGRCGHERVDPLKPIVPCTQLSEASVGGERIHHCSACERDLGNVEPTTSENICNGYLQALHSEAERLNQPCSQSDAPADDPLYVSPDLVPFEPESHCNNEDGSPNLVGIQNDIQSFADYQNDRQDFVVSQSDSQSFIGGQISVDDQNGGQIFVDNQNDGQIFVSNQNDGQISVDNQNDGQIFVNNQNYGQISVDNQNGGQISVDNQNDSQSFVDYQSDSQRLIDNENGNQIFENGGINFVDHQNGGQIFVDNQVGGLIFVDNQNERQRFDDNQNHDSHVFVGSQNDHESFVDDQNGDLIFVDNLNCDPSLVGNQKGRQSFDDRQNGSQIFDDDHNDGQNIVDDHNDHQSIVVNENGGQNSVDTQIVSHILFDNDAGGPNFLDNQNGSQIVVDYLIDDSIQTALPDLSPETAYHHAVFENDASSSETVYPDVVPENDVCADVFPCSVSLPHLGDELTLLCSHRPPRDCAEGGVGIKGLNTRVTEGARTLDMFLAWPEEPLELQGELTGAGFEDGAFENSDGSAAGAGQNSEVSISALDPDLSPAGADQDAAAAAAASSFFEPVCLIPPTTL